MEFWKGWVQSRKLGLLAFAVSFGIWPVFFAIYHFPMEALEYPCILQAAAGAAFFGMDVWKEKEKEKALKRIRELTGEEMNQFPKADDSIEKTIRRLSRNCAWKKKNCWMSRMPDMKKWQIIIPPGFIRSKHLLQPCICN